MTRNGKTGRLLIALSILTALLVPVPGAAAEGVNGTPSATDASMIGRMDKLEARLQEVETEMAQLRRKKQAVQQDLDHQKQEAAALKAQLAQPAAASNSDRPARRQSSEDTRTDYTTPGTQWGTRVGWQEFPYHQQQGGFFYSFFIDHRLFSQAEGVPGGDLGAEINVGVGRSGTDQVEDFSDVLLIKRQLNYRQTMLSAWISMKYHLNYFAPYGVRPYVAAGPGIWADVIESAPLFIGQSLPSKTLSRRKLPVDAAAGLYPGGQLGGGFEVSLARTHLPYLERVNIGFDYRYSSWSSGERISNYSFSLSAGE
jgi:hypothetical protein